MCKYVYFVTCAEHSTALHYWCQHGINVILGAICGMVSCETRFLARTVKDGFPRVAVTQARDTCCTAACVVNSTVVDVSAAADVFGLSFAASRYPVPGRSHKRAVILVEELCRYHVGTIINSIHKKY